MKIMLVNNLGLANRLFSIFSRRKINKHSYNAFMAKREIQALEKESILIEKSNLPIGQQRELLTNKFHLMDIEKEELDYSRKKTQNAVKRRKLSLIRGVQLLANPKARRILAQRKKESQQ